MGWKDDLKKNLSGPGQSPEEARAAAARQQEEHQGGLEAAMTAMRAIRQALDEAHAAIVKARPNLAGSVAVHYGSSSLGFEYVGRTIIEARRDGTTVIIKTTSGENRAIYHGDGEFVIEGMMPMSPEDLAEFVGRVIAEEVK